MWVLSGVRSGILGIDNFLGFPVSLSLIVMIYTSTKALQFLSIPVYTIFKNLTIILIAYGEVLWFGGSVTGMSLFSFGLMVLSSVIAAWADIQHALQSFGHASDEASARISTLNAGYMWMMLNCICSAAYVLGMRKRIKLTNFKDFDSMLRLTSLVHRLLIDLQLCSTTTSSQFPSSSSLPSSSKIGLPKTWRRTSQLSRATISLQPWYSPVFPQCSSHIPRPGVFVSLRRLHTPWSAL